MNPLNKKSFLFFGGGSGLSNILKPFVNSFRDNVDYNLSIIVSTFDNGGSSGIIRSEKKVPALGDLRKVISSLSSESDSIFLEYRFLNKPLSPHTVGNIILENFLNKNRSLIKAIEEMSSIYLQYKATVLPATENYADLVAAVDKKIIFGEKDIGKYENKIIDDLYFQTTDDRKLNSPISNFELIKKSDYIFFAPGSFYTSILASILPHNSIDAIKLSKSKKIMFQNLEEKNFVEKLKFFFDKTEGLLPDYLVSSDKVVENELKRIFPSIKFLYHDFTNEKMLVHDYKKTMIFFEKKLGFLN